MNRRDALKTLAAAALAPGDAAYADAPTGPPRTWLGLVIHSYWIRRDRPLPPDYTAINDPLEFLALAARLGAPGVQIRIPPGDEAYLEKLAAEVARRGMYLEGMVALPKDEPDGDRFAAECQAAKRAGAAVVRTACLSGRRYETFDTRAAFEQFAQQSWKSLTLAEPIVARQGVLLAVENHKDWRIDEMLGWLKRLDSRHVGVCLDTGNSISLLEDPFRVVEAYAPWTFTTHFKDMAVADDEQGFLLSEVPLGEGFLDLKRMVQVLRKARPEVRFNLEMITRDPLKVPCLTPKYFATFEQLPAFELAQALSRVRQQRRAEPLPRVTPLGHVEQLQVEAANIDKSLAFARAQASLT